MSEIGTDCLLIEGASRVEKEPHPEPNPFKTVMVYCIDQKTMQREPIGILADRRKSERDDQNAIGMLRFARKVFATTDEEAGRIMIGEYV